MFKKLFMVLTAVLTFGFAALAGDDYRNKNVYGFNDGDNITTGRIIATGATVKNVRGSLYVLCGQNKAGLAIRYKARTVVGVRNVTVAECTALIDSDGYVTYEAYACMEGRFIYRGYKKVEVCFLIGDKVIRNKGRYRDYLMITVTDMNTGEVYLDILDDYRLGGVRFKR